MYHCSDGRKDMNIGGMKLLIPITNSNCISTTTLTMKTTAVLILSCLAFANAVPTSLKGRAENPGATPADHPNFKVKANHGRGLVTTPTARPRPTTACEGLVTTPTARSRPTTTRAS